jgi:hypothetical protein
MVDGMWRINPVRQRGKEATKFRAEPEGSSQSDGSAYARRILHVAGKQMPMQAHLELPM